ncbi:alpha/beta hydrolase family protein [Pseudomonas sp.]|uniref:alpha/beta hydrolase family protein n=1 Tax=Pseudomonas sp. TaxID=306 RepID=UPI0027370246|nr:alpha/beta hydrolase family protein [Pseudomonas sp.]MDP3815327.1 alpha/beta hydrolase family protein [Pseudomonas sp.]
MLSRHTALALSLLLLAAPLHAEEETPAAAPETPAAPAEDVRAALPERSEVDAQALERQLEQKEQQQLKAADASFLALWLPANVGEPSGAVILIPGDDGNADSALSVGPLRRKLPDAGWHSLSLSLPDPSGDAPPARSTEIAAEPAPVSVDTAEASAEEKPAETAAQPASAAEPQAAADAATTPAPAPAATPEELQKAHAERVLARIGSAIAFAEQQQAKTIVLLGHGSGAYWAARYLAERKPASIHNLLLVAPTLPAGYTPPLDELIPALQLATGDFYYKDLPADRRAALQRSQASKRQKHPAYIQVAMKALPGNREAEQEQLYRRIRGWLTLKLQAQ